MCFHYIKRKFMASFDIKGLITGTSSTMEPVHFVTNVEQFFWDTLTTCCTVLTV